MNNGVRVRVGKGDKQRPVDKKKYDSCPLWDNLKKKQTVGVAKPKSKP